MKKSNLHILCDKHEVNYKDAYNFKRKNPELTDEQIIMWCKPDCYINWLGELVDPNKK